MMSLYCNEYLTHSSCRQEFETNNARAAVHVWWEFQRNPYHRRDCVWMGSGGNCLGCWELHHPKPHKEPSHVRTGLHQHVHEVGRQSPPWPRDVGAFGRCSVSGRLQGFGRENTFSKIKWNTIMNSIIIIQTGFRCFVQTHSFPVPLQLECQAFMTLIGSLLLWLYKMHHVASLAVVDFLYMCTSMLAYCMKQCWHSYYLDGVHPVYFFKLVIIIIIVWCHEFWCLINKIA